MDGKVTQESPRILEQRPKDDGTGPHSNTTRSYSSSSSTVHPGSSDSELCKLMSSGSLESLADDCEEWTTDTEGESYDQTDVNRRTELMNSQAEGAGETSTDVAEQYEPETEDYGVVIEKRFQQLYGFETPDNCCLLDDDWCNQVFQPCAGVSPSWSSIQALDATAQEQSKDQYFPSAGHAITEKEMACISSFLQIHENKSNECQLLAESDNMSVDQIPGNDRTSQNLAKMLQLHESEDYIRNAVAKELVLGENFNTPETGSKMLQRVKINNQTAVDGWIATSDNPSQYKDSAQFGLHGSQLLDSDTDCLQFRALTLGDNNNVEDQVLLSNKWPVTGELHNQPLEFLCLINELAFMNDFVVVSNFVDTSTSIDNDRFALGMRRETCTIEEILSDESADRSTPVAQTASDCVQNEANDPGGKIPAEKQGNKICESTRSATKEQKNNTPKSSRKQPEEYEQTVSYCGDLKKANSNCLPIQEDSAAAVQGLLLPAKSKAKTVFNRSRNKQTKNNHSHNKETASISQITDAEKIQKNRISRGKSESLALGCQPLRHPSCRAVLTAEGMHRYLKAEDSLAGGGGSAAKLLSDNSQILCEKTKTSQHHLAHKAGYCKNELSTSTRRYSNKSENHVSSTLLNDGRHSPVQENQRDNIKLPPIRQNIHEIESGSNVMPSRSLASTENTQDLFEIHRLKNKGHQKSQHQNHRGHLLANLIAIPARKQQSSRTALKLPSLSLQSTPIHKRSHPLAVRRPCTPPNRNVLEARAQWPQFYTSYPSDLDKGVPKRIALKDLPSLKKVPGFSYGVYE